MIIAGAVASALSRSVNRMCPRPPVQVRPSFALAVAASACRTKVAQNTFNPCAPGTGRGSSSSPVVGLHAGAERRPANAKVLAVLADTLDDDVIHRRWYATCSGDIPTPVLRRRW